MGRRYRRDGYITAVALDASNRQDLMEAGTGSGRRDSYLQRFTAQETLK